MKDTRDARALRLVATGIGMTAAAILLFILAPLVWSVLQLFIIVALLAIALEPAVQRLTARGLPRGGAVALVAGSVLLVIGLLIALLAPRLIAQGQEVALKLPGYWNDTLARLAPLFAQYPQLAHALNAERLLSELGSASGWLLTARSIFAGAVGVVTAMLLVLVSTVYTLLQPLPLLYGIRGLFPSSWWSRLDRIGAGAVARIRGWVLGTLLLSLIIGVMDYLALLAINLFSPHDIPYIETFAVIGGLLEIVPVLGPIVATALPALAGFAVNPLLGVLVILAFFVVQQLENHLVVPMVMGKAVHLHPVSLIFALVVFSGLFGLFGAIIAVPAAAIIKVLYDEWYYPLLHDGAAPVTAPAEQRAPSPSAANERDAPEA